VTVTPDLSQLTTDYAAWYFAEHPVMAQMLGADGYDGRLGDLTAEAFQRRERAAADWLARFDQLPAQTGLDDEIDRRLVVAELRGEVILAARPHWRSDPARYVNTVFQGLVMPHIHRLHTDEELAEDSIAKLAQVPEVLAACRENLDPEQTPQLYITRALGQVRGGRTFVTEMLPAMLDDEHLRARVAEAAGSAAAAFDDLAAYLGELEGKASGDWRLGEEIYSALLRERELLGYGTQELHQRGEAAYAELDREMRSLAQAITGDSDDWHAVMQDLQKDHPPTVEAMRAEYEAETERARRFLREQDLVSFAEGEECRVVPTLVYQRPILAVASYLSPPPLTSSRVGHFFVPYPPADFTEEQVQQRLATNSRAQMPTIAVHEAYPGHHWHLSWAAGQSRVLRKIHRTSYFAEGWALYVETVMRRRGYFADPRHEIAHVEARLFRAARIIVDTALHCGGMTFEQAEAFMVEKTALTPSTANGEVSRYCAWPTQAPSYLTGCLEIERIRDDYIAGGLGSLREFHDTLAGSGCLPLGLARAAALGGFDR
jgi:uncharacterized protein (DUF885 family)